MPIFIDSGGFAGLFEGAEIVEYDDYAAIKTREGDELNPLNVLHFQIKNADIGATLDFIIPPGMDEKECIRRQNLTIKNALYAQKQAEKAAKSRGGGGGRRRSGGGGGGYYGGGYGSTGETITPQNTYDAGKTAAAIEEKKKKVPGKVAGKSNIYVNYHTKSFK